MVDSLWCGRVLTGCCPEVNDLRDHLGPGEVDSRDQNLAVSNETMKTGRVSRRTITLEYGTGGLPVTIPAGNVTVLAPRFVPGVVDEQAAFVAAARDPRESAPLSACVGAHDRVAIVIPDITRPLPSDRLLPWVLGEFSHVPAERVTIVIGTGSHRATTDTEIRSLVGESI